MIIAMDYDDTYTADPAFWAAVCDIAERHGHRVLCVTARLFDPEDDEDVEMKRQIKESLPERIPLYFTQHGSKIAYMESQGIKVDVWCDDRPDVVVHGV